MSLLSQHIEQISREKGIDPDVIIHAIEDAILTAAKKYYRTEEPYQARFNRESGVVEVFLAKTIVESVTEPDTEISVKDAREVDKKAKIGSEIELHKPTDVLGRIAAQTAKQVIFQKVREAERDHIYSEYGSRAGELVTGIVKRAESGDLMMDLGKTEAILPRREQSRAEVFNPGERVRLVIVRVSRTARGPQVIVSRTDPALLARLFEQEVPEIYEGTVQVKNAVREPGDRAKVAVHSNDRDVDPVGACVGIKGQRVQNIIRELRGEKIDIVEWNEDPKLFAVNALNPAKVSRVAVVDEKDKVMEVIVEDKQLSLAIGKRGQNVRLAARLLGWRVDIKSEDEKQREVRTQMDFAIDNKQTDVGVLDGLGEKIIARIREQGFDTVEKIVASPDEAASAAGVDQTTAQRLISMARARLALFSRSEDDESTSDADAVPTTPAPVVSSGFSEPDEVEVPATSAEGAEGEASGGER